MNKLFFAAFMACTLTVFGQKAPMKYGDIPMGDLTMTLYDKDSSASAVVLFDFGKAYISINAVSAMLTYERHVRIKILKKDGFNRGDVSIQLYHDGSNEERVTNLKATTYNLENGKVVETKLDKSGIFKEKFNRYNNVQKFTLPNVKEGSVLEYSYTLSSDFLANFPNWQFQRTIPVRHSEYWAQIPEFFVMEKYMQGYLSPTTYEVKDKTQPEYSEKAHHWVMKDVPAFKEEPYMTSEDDYVSRINFALAYINFPGSPSREIMGSWDKLKTQLLESESFGKIITGSGFLKKTTEEVIAGKTEPMQKIEAIHTYVKQTLEWDGTRDKYADNLKKVFEVKKGTAADINLALASMLTKAGFEVDMVLLSTRSHGFIRQQYPMEDQLDYVVCVVRLDAKPIFLDATEKYIPVGVLPERCLNGEGLIVSSKNFGWIPLDTKTKSRTVYSTDLTLNATGELKGKLNISYDGYDALEMRDEYFTDGEEEYLKDFRADQSTWQVEKSEFQNLKEIGKTPKEIHDLQINDHTSLTGDVIYLNPFVIAQLEKNPFTSERREYPVNYGSIQETIYSCRITLPDGFNIDEMPQSKVFVLPGNAAKYLYNVTQAGNIISITSNFQINKTLFAQTDYAALREFYNYVVAKEAEQIVLKKK
jgi:hypothetical protein